MLQFTVVFGWCNSERDVVGCGCCAEGSSCGTRGLQLFWSEDEIDIFGVWEAGKGSTNLLWKNKDGSQNRRFDLLASVFVD